MDRAEFIASQALEERMDARTPVIRFEGQQTGENERSDADGHRISKRDDTAVMHDAEVRILIDPKASPERVGRMLEKIVDWIAREGFEPHYRKYRRISSCKVPDYYCNV